MGRIRVLVTVLIVVGLASTLGGAAAQGETATTEESACSDARAAAGVLYQLVTGEMELTIGDTEENGPIGAAFVNGLLFTTFVGAFLVDVFDCGIGAFLDPTAGSGSFQAHESQIGPHVRPTEGVS